MLPCSPASAGCPWPATDLGRQCATIWLLDLITDTHIPSAHPATADLAITTDVAVVTGLLHEEFGDGIMSAVNFTVDASSADSTPSGAGWSSPSTGSFSSGYEHISANHSGQWQQRLNQVGAYDTNWAQFMMWTTRQAAGRPYYGLPRYSQTTQKFCYTTPVDMRRAGNRRWFDLEGVELFRELLNRLGDRYRVDLNLWF